jgi:hypothetical protein
MPYHRQRLVDEADAGIGEHELFYTGNDTALVVDSCAVCTGMYLP